MRFKFKGRQRDLCALLRCLCDKPCIKRIATFVFQDVSLTVEGTIMLTVKDTDVPGSGIYKFKFVDGKGKPAKVDGVPTISASDNTIVDQIGPVTDNGDGTFQAPYHLTDNVGTSQVTTNADVDLGTGVKNVDFVDVVNILPGEAVAIQGDFGTVTPDA